MFSGLLLYFILNEYFLQGNIITAELINIGDSDSLYLSWRASNICLTSCSALTPASREILLNPGVTGRIRYLGDGLETGYCGAQIQNLLEEDNGNWSLRATNANNVQSSETYTVNVLHYKSKKRTLTAVDSIATNFICGPEEALYCVLTSPRLVVKIFENSACSFILTAIKENHEGLWKCQYALKGYARLQSSSTQLYVKAQKTVDIGFNETIAEVNIFCNAIEDKVVSPFCHLTTPLGIDLYLSAGRGTSRYRYYGSHVTHCGVTITKPLMPDEIGSWLCGLRSSSSSTPKYYGGYIIIEKDRSESLQHVEKAEMKATPNYVFAETKSELTLSCHANFSFEYCWYRSPGGLSFSSDSVERLNFGMCTYTVPNANASHSGEWTCSAGINSRGVIQEIHAKITVDVADRPLIALPISASKATGSSVTLLCKHPKAMSLKYCRFVRPDGFAFTLDEANKKGNYEYAGRGLIMGECGLQIKSLQNLDYGVWTCTTKTVQSASLKSNEYLSTTFMIKSPEGLSLGSVLGISFGSLMIISIVAVIVMKRHPQCKKSETDETELLNENSLFQSTDSFQSPSTDTFSLGTVARSRRKMYRPRILY